MSRSRVNGGRVCRRRKPTPDSLGVIAAVIESAGFYDVSGSDRSWVDPRWEIPSHSPDWIRRHGIGLRGRAHAHSPPARAEAAPQRDGGHPSDRHTVFARGLRRRPHRQPARRRNIRCRPAERGRAVHRHGAARGQDPGPTSRAEQSSGLARDLRNLASGLRRGQCRSQQRDRAPRSEAREFVPREGSTPVREDPGFRDLQVRPCAHRRPRHHAGRRHIGHAFLHAPGTGARRENNRRASRHLLVGSHSVRVFGRSAALRSRHAAASRRFDRGRPVYPPACQTSGTTRGSRHRGGSRDGVRSQPAIPQCR